MADTPSALTTDQVYRECDSSRFTFETTDGLPDLDEIIGQPRAVSAVEFTMGVADPGYNLFAVGPAGTGKSSVINRFLTQEAPAMPVPDDWVYVHNFSEPDRPNAIRLPAGRGHEFSKFMDGLVEELKIDITQAFDAEEYTNERQALLHRFEERAKDELEELNRKAEEQGLLIVNSPEGVMVLPRTPNGQPMPPDAYQALSEDERKRVEDHASGLNDDLQQTSRSVRRVEREGREALRDLDRKITSSAARHVIDDACEHWCETAGVNEFLYRMLDDVVDNADDFKKSEEEPTPTLFGMRLPGAEAGEGFSKYKVNVVVDNSDLKGAPVITESNPVLQNVVGRIEHRAEFGALVTDFNMIRGGALHKANGGFLVLDARELLEKPYAWDALKRTLKTREIRVEDIAKQLGIAATATLDPEPIPFAGKVVLIGEPMLHHLLAELDPDFRELFKIKADFDDVVDRTPESEELYAQFIGHVCRERKLLPFSREAVARVIEHCSRLVEDQKRVTSRFRDVADLATESSYWAGKGHDGDGAVVVTPEHVQKAIDQHTFRSNRVEERLHDMIREATLLVDVKGAVTAQVNGLSVSSVADYAFGLPSRITATHRLGDGEVVDIEREVEMGGPIHSKGVLILAGYLGAKYAAERPLSLNARLVFEQNYSGVEGDSASSTELYALLSSLSGLPIQQRFAVTGSVNQLGQVQAIGGVNEKIEGFFKVCKQIDPDGDHGVLIPASNVRNLMLERQVRDAVEAGRFHIYPVSTIDEGISLLTGVPAGVPDEDGTYPEGSVNRRVVDRLTTLARQAEKHRMAAKAEAKDDTHAG